MAYTTVKELAREWDLSERHVRQYCEDGRIDGAFLQNNRWQIPVDISKPARRPRTVRVSSDIKQRLRGEKEKMMLGGVYHNLMTRFTYVSSIMDGAGITFEQVKNIYENNTIKTGDDAVSIDDIVETANHFRCIDLMIDQADASLTQELIKQIHVFLKVSTSVSWNPWYSIGEYASSGLPGFGSDNEVSEKMKKLLNSYNRKKERSLEDIIELYVGIIRIHPFRDSNGRIARLVCFKECLRNNFVPFIITEELIDDFNVGMLQWNRDRSILTDVCITAQDNFKKELDSFGIMYF